MLRKTTDGGRRWSTVTAPPAPWTGASSHPAADAVISVLFADARDGWAYGPGLWATHDGGASWHRVGTGGHAVYAMAVTGGHAVAAFLTCPAYGTGVRCEAPATFTVEATPARADAWRPVPGASGKGSPELVASGGRAYAVGVGDTTAPPSTRLTLLGGPASGSARWRSEQVPCYVDAALAAAATSGTQLLLACAMEGAHPTPTRMYASADAGAHWTRFATVGMYDGASVIGRAPGGRTLLAGGIYDGILLSRDGGRSWQGPAAIDRSDPVGGGLGIKAALLSARDGYALAEGGPFWITRDGGLTWTKVTVR